MIALKIGVFAAWECALLSGADCLGLLVAEGLAVVILHLHLIEMVAMMTTWDHAEVLQMQSKMKVLKVRLRFLSNIRTGWV